ncbi:hypothetical protein BBJ28_00012269 [Nothophytophthora sp. Chile5]|nr:hypothetical protein BBJ28_00012269 [Nothophytophthora sp. Chile5]
MFQLVPRYYDNARAARESDILVLCTPPSQLKSVAIQIRHALAASVDAPLLLVSTLCGVTRQSLSKACGSQSVVRVQPDVAKIASLWHEQEEPDAATNECAAPHPQGERDLAQEATERNRLLLPLQLAAVALVFAALCRRVLDQEDQDARRSAASVLFGGRSEVVMVALAEGDEMQRQQEEPRTLVVPSWPAEWEQDLAELQAHLAQKALSG